VTLVIASRRLGSDRGRVLMTRAAKLVGLSLSVAVLLCACAGNDGETTTSRSPQPSGASVADTALQLRPVEAIGDSLPLTCGGNDAPCTTAKLLDPQGITLEGRDGQRFELGALLLAGSDVAQLAVTRDPMDPEAPPGSSWAVSLTLTKEARSVFASATTNAVPEQPPRNQIAVVVDGVVHASPTVVAPIRTGSLQVSGLSREAAESLADKLAG
jgi:hypothetical protein